MSTSPEISTRTTGVHRAHREARDRAAARTLAQCPPARYEPYLDGLFTYCLSVLCDHDAATAAVRDVLALAERRGRRGPEAAEDRRAWLYALARWACLRKLAQAGQKRQVSRAASRAAVMKPAAGKPGRAKSGGTKPASAKSAVARSPAAAPGAARSAPEAGAGPVREEAQERRRRELALLAWPEAAGTSPEQREALELAVRHRLAAHEVAAVLGMDRTAARELLAAAACEVERTRAALAVVETGTCPGVTLLTGDDQLVLGTALRHELVRHVDGCPRCRRTAERAVPGRWPGATVTPAELPVLAAPRAALHTALAHPPRGRGAAAPRFDRRGFPMDPEDRAARRDRLRARAVTTTVVATVVAAPVFALWSAYRGAPADGSTEGRTPGASGAQGPGGADGEAAGHGYRNTGNADVHRSPGTRGRHGPNVSVEVLSVAGVGRKGAGQLEVRAANSGTTTLITLTASGPGPVRWSATTRASWLYLSRSSGTLEPGESLTVKVYVDHLREPSGHWSAQVAIAPAGAVVTIDGRGAAPAPVGPRPGGQAGPPPPGPGPTPTASASSGPAPTDPPSAPGPQPTPTDPAPTLPPGDPAPPSGDTATDPAPAATP
jgi:DNA-directed RNA polymerase specialized sigma24 family protein